MKNLSGSEAFIRYLAGMAILINIFLFDLFEIQLIIYLTIGNFLIMSAIEKHCLIYDVVSRVRNR